jgi:hypothetical protein
VTIHVPADFTLDQLLAHLRGEPDVDGFFTAREWAERFDVSIQKMRLILSEAKQVGKLRMEEVWRERLDGRMTRIMGYTFVLDDGNDQGADV